jgi:DNA-binding MarR family transcriptional regulator
MSARPAAAVARIRRPARTAAAPPAPEPDPEPDRTALELRTLQDFRVIVGSARAYDATVRRVTGISGSQLWALSEIARSAGMSVNALSARMAIHQTTASNLVNALRRRGLIRRTRDGADQRVARLHLASEGRRLILLAPRPHAGLLIDALRHLDARQIALLRQGLAVLTAALRRTVVRTAGHTMTGE